MSVSPMVRLCALCFALVVVFPGGKCAAQAQAAAADTLYQVRLIDGTTIIGRLASSDSTTVVVISLSEARFELKRSQIRDMREARGRVVNGEFWPADPNDTRLFFVSTARSVGAGQGYVGTFFIVFPFAAIGITDRITLAGGAPILFGRLDPFYLAPKVQLIRAEKLGVSVGTLSMISVEEDDFSFGVLYANATVGTSDNAFTGGIGFGYAGDDVANQPVLALGGETRVSRRIKLITENYLVVTDDGFGLFSGGLRILGERIATDVGVFGAFGSGDAGCCFPMLSFSYAFGSRRMR